VRPDPARNILLMAHLDRRGRNKPALGLVKGMGLKQGALANSLIWDTNNILVIGADESDMAQAVGRLLELGGGFVVWAQGQVKAELPLPMGGIISSEDLATIVRLLKDTERAAHELGCQIPRPFLALQTLPFTGLPFIRLTDKGLVDIKKGRLVETILGPAGS
ncbi:MAG: adenine deaminase, partial [Deltaproteobacteria bacterium]|nr:adenine deaminase [Deltaproteobacteria bacterium]